MTACSGGGLCAPRPLVFHTFSRTGGGAPGSDVGGGDDDDDDDDDDDTDNDMGTSAPRRGVTTTTTIGPLRETRYAGYCCTGVGSTRPMRRSTGSAASRRVEKFDGGADSDMCTPHKHNGSRSVAVAVQERIEKI